MYDLRVKNLRGRQCQTLVFSLREVGSQFHVPAAKPNGLTFCIRVSINSSFLDKNYSIGEASTSSLLSESWLSGSAKCKSNWHISTFKFVFPDNYCLYFICVNWQLPNSVSKSTICNYWCCSLLWNLDGPWTAEKCFSCWHMTLSERKIFDTTRLISSM